MIDRYDAKIVYLDREIGRLLEEMESRNLLENTIVALVADHGETFYDHGVWGHGRSLYDEELRVPFALIGTGRVPAGNRVQPIVRMVDVMLTLLELLDVEAPGSIQGKSLVSLLGADEGEDLPSYSEIELGGKKYDSTWKGRHKLIRTHDGKSWLFDMDDDPEERNDISGERPDIAAELLEEIESFLRLLEQEAFTDSRESTELDETTIERLKALGYIQ